MAGTITTTDTNIDIAALTVAANTTITTGAATVGDIAITGTINADDATANDRTLTIVAGTGTATFGNTIGATQALADFDVTAATINLNAATFRVDDVGGRTVTLTGAVVLGVNTVTIDTDGAAVDNNLTFTSTIDADDAAGQNRTLVITAGGDIVTFGGNVGVSQALADFDVTAATINLNAATFILDDGAAGERTFTGAVVLGANVTIDTNGTADSAINFDTAATTINADNAANDRTLTLDAGTGIVSFDGLVGGGAALADLDVTATTINLNAATFTIDAGGGATVTLTGAVVLGAASLTIDTDGTNDNNLTFTSTINADNISNNRTLTITAGTGTVTFGGNVGATAELADFDVTAATINLNAATFRVDDVGGQTVTLTGAVVLGVNTVTIDTDGALVDNNLTFTSTIDADDAAGQNRTLVITAGDDIVTFGGNVGVSQALADFDVTAATITFNTTTVTVDDGAGGATVTLTGAVVLGGNLTIDTDGTADNSVNFTSTIVADNVANDRTLTVTADGGTVTFGGNVGGTALADFDVTAATINLNAATFNIEDGDGGATVTLTGAVVLGAATVAIDTNGVNDNNITFTSTVGTGANNLTLDAGAAGDIAVNGALTGGGVLTVTDSGSATFASTVTVTTLTLSLTTGAITFNGDVTATAVNTAADGYAVVFNEDATITNDLTFLNTGGVTLGNASDDALLFTGGLSTVAGATTAAGTITTTSTNIDIAALTITDTTTITTGATTIGIIALSSTVAGTTSDDLTLISGTSATTVASTVGTGGNIGTLTLQANAAATGTVTFSGDVTATTLTTFAQAYAVVFNENLIVTNDVNFLNTAGVTLGNGVADTLTFNGGLDTTAGATTVAGTIITSGDNIDIAALTITNTTIITTGVSTAGNLSLTSTVAGTSTDDLSLISGSGTITVAGAVGGNIGTLTLQANDPAATGTVTFNGDVTAATVTTSAQAYAVVFNEDATITNDLTFANTGGVTLGNASDDNLTFNGGLGSIGGTTTVAGTITTSADDIDIAALTVAANTTITTGGGAAAGNIALTSTVVGTSADNLTLISGTGTITVTNALGANNQIATLALLENIALVTGTVTFNGDVTATTLTTFAQAYSVVFNENATITNDTNFLNTAGVTLGTATDDAYIFTDGLGSIGGATTAVGSITTTGTNIDIAALTILDATTITTGESTAGDIALTSTVAGTTADVLTLVSGSGTTTVTGTVGAGNQMATLILQANDAGATGTVTFDGNVTLSSTITTFARAYAVVLNEDATITADVNFLNTGGVMLGTATDDAYIFTGGLGSIGGATTAVGSITTTSTNIDIAALTILDATTITTGASTAGDIALTSTVAGTSADILTLVSGSGTTTVTGAVGAGNQIATLILQANDAGATGTVTFNGNVTATSTITTFAQAYAVVLNEDATITADVNFLNTGGVTLGNASDDNLTFNGGLGSVAVGGTTTVAGTITTSADNIDIAALTITDNTTITTGGGAAAGNIALTRGGGRQHRAYQHGGWHFGG